MTLMPMGLALPGIALIPLGIVGWAQLLPFGAAAMAKAAVAPGGATAAATSAATAIASAATGPSSPGQRLCFQRLSGQGDRIDVEQLWIEQRGSRLRGDYRWIPWGKDRRVGQLSGRLLSPGNALLLYNYMQEGERSSEALILRFDAQQAQITWQETPLSPDPLPRHPCNQLRPLAKP